VNALIVDPLPLRDDQLQKARGHASPLPTMRRHTGSERIGACGQIPDSLSSGRLQRVKTIGLLGGMSWESSATRQLADQHGLTFQSTGAPTVAL